MSAQNRARAGKFTKPKRGGGKHFSRDLQPVNADGETISMWAVRDSKQRGDEDDEDDEDESSEEESSEDEEDQPQTREERKAAAKARKEAAIAKQKAAASAAAPGDLPPSDEDDDDDDDMPANPNHTSKARQQLSTESGANDAAAVSKKPLAELSRREREALQAEQARERYQKLHAEGKTDEARADLERLRLVREQREAAAARKKAETEEKAEADKSRKEQLDREKKQRDAAMGAGASKRGAKGGKKK